MTNRFDRLRHKKGRFERLTHGKQRISIADYRAAKKLALKRRPKN